MCLPPTGVAIIGAINHSKEKVLCNTNTKIGFVQSVTQRTCLARQGNQCLHFNTSDEILYFVDRASRYNSLLMTYLAHFFISLFITPLYMFQAS